MQLNDNNAMRGGGFQVDTLLNYVFGGGFV
jgi:hypothetical protein